MKVMSTSQTVSTVFMLTEHKLRNFNFAQFSGKGCHALIKLHYKNPRMRIFLC